MNEEDLLAGIKDLLSGVPLAAGETEQSEGGDENHSAEDFKVTLARYEQMANSVDA